MIIEKGICCVPEGYYYHSDNEPWLSRRGVAVYQRGTIITVTRNLSYLIYNENNREHNAVILR